MILYLASFSAVFVYGLLLFCLRRGFERLRTGCSADIPAVSVIVPARNEEKHLPDLLERLSAQIYPVSRIEIILVDDRSTDETARIMSRFSRTRPNVRMIRVRETEAAGSAKKQALARGIGMASGEIIVTTDADTLPGPRWIQSLAAHYEPGVDVVLGYAPYRTDGPYRSLFHKLLALDYLSLGAIAAAGAGLQIPTTSSGANLSYRKTLFEQVGGFGETIRHHSGDDDLLIHRFRDKARAVFRYAVERDAAVPTRPPEDFRAFLRQRVRFASKHLAYPRNMTRILSFVYAVYVLLLAIGIASCFMPKLLPLFGLMLFWKSACELCFLLPARRLLEDRNLLKYYPLAVIPHILYVVLLPVLGQILPKRW
ncbi:MAG TPA: glycosyltransferase [bacterium]|nr:glycosyltransferase [bacterium]